jgi:hypothetical protein
MAIFGTMALICTYALQEQINALPQLDNASASLSDHNSKIKNQ